MIKVLTKRALHHYFISTPTVTSLTNLYLLTGNPYCYILRFATFPIFIYEIMYLCDKLARRKVFMMLLEHLNECVEVINEGFGLGDGETIDIFNDFVLISFDLLGHLLMLYIVMMCLALYTSQIK